MTYVHDDDDSFYDYEEAMQQVVAAPAGTVRSGNGASTVVRPAPSCSNESVTRKNQYSSGLLRPTLGRSHLMGRPTTTFDAFLSDSDDDSDDGSAIQRMQEQADDMEYIDIAFELDSPNGYDARDDDANSVCMDAHVHGSAQPASSRNAAPRSTVVMADWARRMSRAATLQHDSSDDNDSSDDAANAVTQPVAGHTDSFVDPLDASFRLIRPDIIAAPKRLSRRDDSDSNSDDSSDASFTLSSSSEDKRSVDDSDSDSVARTRSSHVDVNVNERLDDRNSSDRRSQLDRTLIDDSYAGKRPSNLDRSSVRSSFMSDKPSYLNQSLIDDSIVSQRPSLLDRSSRLLINSEFIGHWPSTFGDDDVCRTSLTHASAVDKKAVDSACEHGSAATAAIARVRRSIADAPVASSSESASDDEPLVLLHLPAGIDSFVHNVESSFERLHPSTASGSSSSVCIDALSLVASATSITAAASVTVALPAAAAAATVCERATPSSRASASSDCDCDLQLAVGRRDAQLKRSPSDLPTRCNDHGGAICSDSGNDADALTISILESELNDADDALGTRQLRAPRASAASVLELASQDRTSDGTLDSVDAVESVAAAATTVCELVAPCSTHSDGSDCHVASLTSLLRESSSASSSSSMLFYQLSSLNSASRIAECAHAAAAGTDIPLLLLPVSSTDECAIAVQTNVVAALSTQLTEPDETKVSDSDSDDLDASSRPLWTINDMGSASASSSSASASAHQQSIRSAAISSLAPSLHWSSTYDGRSLLPSPVELRTDTTNSQRTKDSSMVSYEASVASRPTVVSASTSYWHRVSASVRSTLQHTGARLFGDTTNTQQPPTSPPTDCTAPPKRARAFDDRHFYDRFARGGGIESNDNALPAAKRYTQQQQSSRAAETRTLLLLLIGIALGIALGVVLVYNESLGAVFDNVESPSQDLNQAVQWLLLPGTLFLRLTHCVALPLLFCHVLTGVADLALDCKARVALSKQSLAILLVVSTVTTLEGLGVMVALHGLDAFRPTQATAVAADTLRWTVHHARSSIALQCVANSSTYLHALGESFECTNASSTSAMFVLFDVHSVALAPVALHSVGTSDVATAGFSDAYRSPSLALNDVAHSVVDTLVPTTVGQSLLEATPVGAVAFALALGLVSGRRVYKRSISAQCKASAHISDSKAAAADAPHYVLGVVVELQLALEAIALSLETLAPFGALSLLAGALVQHRLALLTLAAPTLQLVASVMGACVLHIAVVTPLALAVVLRVSVVGSMSDCTFARAYAMCFATGSVVLALPTVQHCFSTNSSSSSSSNNGHATKSMAQASLGVLSVLHRNAHALYYPIALLWLLQTSTSSALTDAGGMTLSLELFALVGALGIASCFVVLHPVAHIVAGRDGGSNALLLGACGRVVLMFMRRSDATSTLPLLVACDVLLARFVMMVNLHGNLVVARLVAEYCDEVVVIESSTTRPVDSTDLAPSPMYV